jgi:hypothetical protein
MFGRLSLVFLCLSFIAAPAFASERAYFDSVQGKWSGAGEIIAGKYKNTRFSCNFTGKTPRSVGMEIDGTCRVGLFSQPMSAVITKKGARFSGKFLDGAAGKGLDLEKGRLHGNKLVLAVNRNHLDGQMVANLRNPNQLHITISVKTSSRLVPVIGLTLNRKGASKTSFLKD